MVSLQRHLLSQAGFYMNETNRGRTALQKEKDRRFPVVMIAQDGSGFHSAEDKVLPMTTVENLDKGASFIRPNEARFYNVLVHFYSGAGLSRAFANGRQKFGAHTGDRSS